MSTYTAISSMVTKTDRMFEKAMGVSLAFQKSTSFMRNVESATKYTMGVMPMLDSTAWMRNDAMVGYSNFNSSAIAYKILENYPKPLTIPKWILDLNSSHNALKGAFTAQSNWQKAFPVIPENSAVKSAMDIVSGLAGLNVAAKSIADMSKLSESILRFDTSINQLYKFINNIDEDYDDFEIDINSQLTAAIAYDVDNAITEDKKIAIVYIFQSMLDNLSNISVDFTLGNEQKLLLNKLKSLVDEWKKNGMIFNSLVLLCYVFQPVIEHYHNEILGLEDDKPSLIINQSKIENNNYTIENSLQVVTTAIKYLKDKADNRLKVKFIIPIGTQMDIVQDNGKWIKVKFTCKGAFYSGWTLNSDIK
ncbi:hypothetical protein [Flavobacterium sp.]|uniref:hypothetical protein n=1 Tax=Flavobacterium sp. TaxID=239 RepID=UPI003D6B881A